MIEIYLFVNPLGSLCFNIEKDILNLVETENKKIQFRFIPLVNMKTVNFLMEYYQFPSNDIKKRNQLFEDLYCAALDYKAAQLQGKKRGRHLLLGLQQAVDVEHTPYSSELTEKLLVETGADLTMFRMDRQSSFVKESFHTDQQIAREMGVVNHPSAVIFNYSSDRDFGVLIENCHHINEIRHLCSTRKDDLDYLQNNFNLGSYDTQPLSYGHLYLL